MKLLDFAIIKLTFCLVFGIIWASAFSISLNWSLCITGFFIILTFAFWVLAKKQLVKPFWFGIISFSTFISIGILTVNLHNQKNFEDHYSHKISSKSESHVLLLKVREVLKSSAFHDKYVVNVIKMNNNEVSGKILLNIAKDSSKNQLTIDEEFLIKTNLAEINTPLNPNQFNYKNYLEKKYIFHQIYTDHSELFKLKSNSSTIFGSANHIRTTINEKLKKYDFKGDELAIINALLLGQRQDIDRDIYENYTNAGAIHILAVSGLHVGIILLLISFALKPIEQIKHGVFIKTLLIVLFLWCFAVVAGLSASVTRAVSMFSILAIGLQMKRPANIYNSIAISVFFLLLVKPMFLFDVGFQLSYAAVLGIVSIYPLIYKLWKPKHFILDKFWQIFIVSLAAQIGVIPLSLFYFHQFPGLFWLSNLVIIPFLGLILGLGLIIILMALLGVLPSFLARIYESIIRAMNLFIEWVSVHEEFLIKDISFGIIFVITTYLIIASTVRYIKNKSFHNLIYAFVAILFFQATLIYKNIENQQIAFIVFHKSRKSLIGEKTGTKFIVHHNLDSIENNFILKNYCIGNHIKEIKEDTLKNIYQIADKKLLVIDSLGIYNVKSFKPSYVLLRDSPKINLNRLIDSINPELVIADGSNYISYIERWEETCNKRKLPFYQTGKKGAYIFNFSY
ncbi:ComEC/Rec2 family competence protein [Yeosuana sp. MJ-SS3]|uniref:ComEC/Rec2 family competence protein n=1 Tax=Gilvirhabdus luticola TaxID=3079858 RepID=A0ABU3U450_9FLAO|nr:ComEC/Rec2 family competence protein [Yeosuana sp. MJ-SS3]MDU8885178.1 ComEC/Rec2 family competence protein [Yeosuana sp. MJ-SS3]